MFALFCDLKIKNLGKSENEDKNEILEIIFYVFKLLIEKDEFLEFYRIYVGKRILQFMNIDIDFEKELICKFKGLIGFTS